MKSFLLLLLVVGVVGSSIESKIDARTPATSADLPECQVISTSGKSVRKDCIVHTDTTDKAIHVLELKGDSATVSYDQGRLMAAEIEDGMLGSLVTMNKKITNNVILRALYGCYMGRMKRSVTPEFLEKAKSMYAGYVEGLKAVGRTPQYQEKDMIEGILGIEVANVAEGLAQRLESNVTVIGEVFGTCALLEPYKKVASLVRSTIIDHGSRKPKLGGCLGFSIPASANQFTDTPSLVHSRNLDIDMVDSWNKFPVFMVVDQSGKNKFVAGAGAGMLLPGGIGGMNEKGLVISLHEMSTTQYVSAYADHGGYTAPAMTQKILEEASSIDEVVKVMNSVERFASWTIFVSEQKTGRVASIEFSPGKIRIARQAVGQAMGQSNHFIDPEMKDQYFTYNFNKYLESVSRLAQIEKSIFTLSKANLADREWVIDHLSSHEESVPGTSYHARRAFGRTAVKAYNVMSTIGVPGANEYYMTLGERIPAAHSTFIGFKIDWQNASAKLIDQHRTVQYASTPNWEKSLTTYAKARVAFVKFLDNDPVHSVDLLDQSIAEAKQDGIDELPYRFTRARVLDFIARDKRSSDAAGYYEKSLAEWNGLWNQRGEFFEYGQALIALYSVAASDALSNFDSTQMLTDSERKTRTEFAVQTLSKLTETYSHFDLQAKLKLAKKFASEVHARQKLPSIDFVVVEQ